MEAQITAVNLNNLNERSVPLTNNFFREVGTKNTLLPDEFVAKITFKIPEQVIRSEYYILIG